MLGGSDVAELVTAPLWSVGIACGLCLDASSPCASNLLSNDAGDIGSAASIIGIAFSVREPELSSVVRSKRKAESGDVVC